MKKILFLIIVGICIFLSLSLLGSIANLWQKQDLVKNASKQLEVVKNENRSLKNELRVATVSGFMEEEARNKLFMVKEGEKTVVIPDSLLKKVKKQEVKQPQKSNIELWISLFFQQKP